MAAFADLATAASFAAFTTATVYGIAAIRRGAQFRETVWYVTVVAAANAVFRGVTGWHRLQGLPVPDYAVNIALVLQIALATALLLILAVARLQVRTPVHLIVTLEDEGE